MTARTLADRVHDTIGCHTIIRDGHPTSIGAVAGPAALREVAEAVMAEVQPVVDERDRLHETLIRQGDDRIDYLLRDSNRLRAALSEIRDRHRPDPDGGMGFREDHSYGEISPACLTCGTSSEYAARWPCHTRRTAERGLAGDEQTGDETP